MNFRENTGKTIQTAFEDFHKKNPKVYEMFKKYALEAIKKGKKKISFKLIMNVIRWEVFMVTDEPTLFNNKGQQTKFKINDAYGSRYARLFVADYPQYKGKIELRSLRSM
jgi:hypothetical protein